MEAGKMGKHKDLSESDKWIWDCIVADQSGCPCCPLSSPKVQTMGT